MKVTKSLTRSQKKAKYGNHWESRARKAAFDLVCKKYVENVK